MSTNIVFFGLTAVKPTEWLLEKPPFRRFYVGRPSAAVILKIKNSRIDGKIRPTVLAWLDGRCVC